MVFRYSLTYEEAFEAFYRLAARRSPRARRLVAAALIVLGAVLVVLYGLYPHRLEYFVLPILVVLTYGGVVYYPTITARRGAKKVTAKGGTYQVELKDDGRIIAAGETVDLAGDRDARAFETDFSFVIRPDRVHTFCLPKRVMSDEEIAAVRGIIKTHMRRFTGKDPAPATRPAAERTP